MRYLFIISVLALLCSNCKEETQAIEHPNESAEHVGEGIEYLNVNDEGKDYLMGHFDPATHDKFVLIEDKFADRSGMYMRKEAYEAFIQMYKAAQTDSVNLVIRSATRNFNYQKGIWQRKWSGTTKLEGKIDATTIATPEKRALEILKWSSMPGTSRHHWGTDIDFNAFNNTYFESGKGLKEYNWLKKNALTYGFGQPYTAKDSQRPDGYNEEKWHWSYLPLSTPLTRKAEQLLADGDIKGFDGADQAEKIEVVEKYVLGINPKLK